MNRMVIGGIAALVAAGGGGAWWYASNREAAPAIVAGPREPAAQAQLEAEPAPAPEADAAPAPQATLAQASEPAVAAAPKAGSFTIERGVCFGPCPVYSARVTGDDRLVFEGRKFCAREGEHARDLPAGSFARLVEIAVRHDFGKIASKWPSEKALDCPEPAADLATVSVSIASEKLTHAIKFYEGCKGYPGAERLGPMLRDIDAVLGIDEWVGPREAWYGKRDKKP